VKWGVRSLLLAAALTATACGTGTQVAGDPAEDLGACQIEGHVDHAEAAPFVAGVKRWLTVEGTGSANLADSAAPLEDVRNVSVELSVTEVGSETSAHLETITIHNTMLPAIDWALANEATVHLGLGQGGDGEEEVLLTLVTEATGSHFFGGNCQFDGLTSPLRAHLGARYDETMEQLIGMTDGDEILKLLGPETEPDAPTEMILNPEDADPATLEKLSVVTLALAVPQGWAGPYTICTAIQEGWNDCIDVSSAAGETTLIDAYYADDKRLEVWLLDENAALASPLQHLGTADLSLVPEAILEHPSGAVVQLSLEGTRAESSAELIANPSVSIGASESHEWVFAHPRRGATLFGTVIVDAEPSGVIP
jgi:hypothetical protein